MKKIIYILLLSTLFFIFSCEEESNNLEPLYEIGDFAEGGIVFYIDETSNHGLVAALNDIQDSLQWGCYSEFVEGAVAYSIGTGYQNTLAIIYECSELPIAASEALAYESDGYDDW